MSLDLREEVALKPCPVCRGAAKLSRLLSPAGIARGDAPSYDIECSECWVHGRWNTQADAVAAWNRRAPDPQLSASEDLREAVARMICRKAREWQGFPEKFLADEVEGAWPLFLSDADAILAALSYAGMVEALEPFAQAAKDADEETVPDTASAWESAMAMTVTFGDFRAAARALSLQGGER